MNIQWFPGHMAKTRRLITDNLKLVDVIIELLDARIPMSSKNPEIDKLINNKPKIIAFNKADLADEAVSKEWKKWFNKNGSSCIFIDCIKGTGINELKKALREATSEKLERAANKGIIHRSIKTMVVGIPNVGKSSFINKVAGKAGATTGDKPGVTRGKQWIRLNDEIELLDMPGILWPRFEDELVGKNLAFTGAIKDDILDTLELAGMLLKELSIHYPQKLAERFKLQFDENTTGNELLEMAGRKRGCLISGGEIDLYRIAAIVLDEFRGGKIGKITLERPVFEDSKN